jgi:hypothetical protein
VSVSRRKTIRIWTQLLTILFVFTLVTGCTAQTLILLDHVGYETRAPKRALVLDAPSKASEFSVIDCKTNRPAITGKLERSGSVANWGGKYSIADFSILQTPGKYVLRVHADQGDVRSYPFSIEDNLLERHTLSNVIHYFKGQRLGGAMDRVDRRLPLPGGQSGSVDVHGGWMDATGDYGIHLSHQNPSSYFNPQQAPLVVWTLLKSYRALEARHDDNFTEYQRRLVDEGLYGADFLVRVKSPNGSFFETIQAPGAGKLAKDRMIGDPNWKTVIKESADSAGRHIDHARKPQAYEVSFRSGGGMAIAALALASTMPEEGDFSHNDYRRAAEEAFDFLSKHNQEIVNDGVENIIDDYCALLAATELYRATQQEKYRRAADFRANSLMARLVSNDKYQNYWSADDKKRPFFHPSDAGLPLISLLEYMQIAAPIAQEKALNAVERSLRFELKVTSETNNPFGYARQLVRMGNGEVRTAFFFPHDTEAAPWWQGENARLASLAAAARMAAPLFEKNPQFRAQLEDYAWSQLHWILGRNPFDASMLIGTGHNNAEYMFFHSYKYTNAPGAIINGITAAPNDPDGIAFNEGYAVTGKDDDWRWTEQWLPHAAWYLYTISLPR